MHTPQPNIFRLLAVQLFVVFLMLSCASGQPTRRLTIHVPKDFVGTVRVATCAGSSSAVDIYAGTDGVGETSTCPLQGEDVAVILMRGEEQRAVTPAEVVIPRTGDGIATSIQVSVRP